MGDETQSNSAVGSRTRLNFVNVANVASSLMKEASEVSNSIYKVICTLNFSLL